MLRDELDSPRSFIGGFYCFAVDDNDVVPIGGSSLPDDCCRCCSEF